MEASGASRLVGEAGVREEGLFVGGEAPGGALNVDTSPGGGSECSRLGRRLRAKQTAWQRRGGCPRIEGHVEGSMELATA